MPTTTAIRTSLSSMMGRWSAPSSPGGTPARDLRAVTGASARADDPSKVWELPALTARGEQVYAANCQVCHQANGKGGGNVKALDGSPTVLDADKTKQIHVLLNGQNNGAMPA